jgi:CheY-like chemotaxis protein
VSTNKGHVLVVEDDEETRRLVKAVLQRAGYELTLAADGAVGLERPVEGDAFGLELRTEGAAAWTLPNRSTSRPGSVR